MSTEVAPAGELMCAAEGVIVALTGDPTRTEAHPTRRLLRPVHFPLPLFAVLVWHATERPKHVRGQA